MKKINVAFLSLLSLFSVLAIIFPAKAQSNRFSFEKYSNGQGDTLNYRLLGPDYNTSRKFPLVIFLHGSGERGNDNIAQLKWGVLNFATDEMMMAHPAFVIAPQCPENQAWSNFKKSQDGEILTLNNSPSRPMELVLALIKDFIKKHDEVDTNRIYITGLSMGGYGTFDAVSRMPNLFAAAVPVCGGGDTGKANLISKVPMWIFHGAEDPAVPTHFSLDMATALFKAGAHPGLTIYPETSHFSWLAAYRNQLMMDWLFRQRR